MKQYLLLTSALAVLGLSGVAEAACIQTPNCTTLGYTSTTACEGGLKCPWGEAWFCPTSSESGGEETPDYGTCQIGDILYSDKTCNPTLSDNKSPIGVVFDNTNNLAIGLYTNNYTYAVNSFIVSGVPAYENQSQAEADLNGKENTKKTIEYCNANGYSCPAFEYVNSYITAGTQAGDWYLPALGELKKIYTLSDTLNRTLLIIGGTELPKKIPTGELNYGHLSSTKYEDWGAWGLAFYYGDFIKFQNNYGYTPFVRPVINYGEWRGN